jgi:hypothetical protein
MFISFALDGLDLTLMRAASATLRAYHEANLDAEIHF